MQMGVSSSQRNKFCKKTISTRKKQDPSKPGEDKRDSGSAMRLADLSVHVATVCSIRRSGSA